MSGFIHNIVDAPQLLDTAAGGIIEALYLSHIHGSDADHLGSRAGGRNVFGNLLGLLDIAADDACVGAEVDESADLRAAYRASAAGAKDYFILWTENEQSADDEIADKQRRGSRRRRSTE